MKLLHNPRAHLFVISFLLFIIPFFWIKPGEMDLGGDSSRLYFYDPINYLKNYSLYNVLPFGTGLVEPNFYNLPTVILLAGMKLILKSPYLLISIFNSIKLVVAFLAVYGIAKELIDKKSNNKYFLVLSEISSMLAGLFYIFSPKMIGNWDKALLSHDQVFLNPLMFYLILKYFLTYNIRYLLIALVTSFVLASNFAWASAPPFFAFYPLSLLFLLFYTALILRKKLPWKGIIIGLLIFFGLHSFHLIPEIINLFDPGSYTNTRVFSRQAPQLDYFFGVLPLAKVSLNILSLSPIKELGFASIMVPLVLILGFLLNTKNLPAERQGKKTLLLTGIFFLTTLFLLSAKITDLGIELYKRLFYIPGFGMFRNFIGQWLFVFSFFYALLFGQALFLVFSRFKQAYAGILYFGIGLVLILGAWPFINGELVNKTHFQSNNVKIAMVMDPKYEKTLAFIRSLPDDGKILTLPFTDCCYQVIHGTNNGAYVGVSTIGYLTGKKDFAGYANIAPFSEVFLKLAQEGDYMSIKQMLGLLNVRYIFHNKDPRIYDATFPGYPYAYVRKFFPNDQKGYSEFLSHITSKKVFEDGPYKLYLTDTTFFLPHFYIPRQIIPYEVNGKYDVTYGLASSFFPDKKTNGARSIFIEKQICAKKICSKEFSSGPSDLPKIKFERINPTKYKIEVSEAKKSYFLVFSEAFHKNWKVFISKTNISQKDKITSTYFNGDVEESIHKNIFFDTNTFETIGMKRIPDDNHSIVNGYANAWNITPQDTGGKENYELIVEMTDQRIFYVSLALSLIVFLGCVLWGVMPFVKGSHSDIIRKNSD